MKRYLILFSLIVSTIVVNAQQTPEQAARLEADNALSHDFGLMYFKLDSSKSKILGKFEKLTPVHNDTIFKSLCPYSCGEVFRIVTLNYFGDNYYIARDLEIAEYHYLFVNDKLSGIYTSYYSRGQFWSMLINLRQDFGHPVDNCWRAKNFTIIIDWKKGGFYRIVNDVKERCENHHCQDNE